VLPSRQFLLFCMVGAVNTAFGYSIFAVLLFLGLGRALALLLATCAGVLFNYFSTGRIVFGNRGAGKLPRFVASYGVVYVCNLAVMEALVALGVNAYAAGAISILSSTVIAFVLNRLFVFSRQA
jgi:putative flippase GtrA